MLYIDEKLRKASEPANSKLRQETFQRTPLFAGLSPLEREAIASLAIERHYKAGETLFFEASPCQGLHVIGAGAVKILKTAPSGREVMLAVETAPSSVAEVPLFDGGDYPATVTAIQDTIAYLLLKEDFRRFCQAHPEVPLKVLAVVGKRLRQLVMLVEAITFGSVRQRLARMLLEFWEQHGQQAFELPISHEELAMRLGSVREVISRNLSRFQAEGFLNIYKRKIEIVDVDALRREAEASS